MWPYVTSSICAVEIQITLNVNHVQIHVWPTSNTEELFSAPASIRDGLKTRLLKIDKPYWWKKIRQDYAYFDWLNNSQRWNSKIDPNSDSASFLNGCSKELLMDCPSEERQASVRAILMWITKASKSEFQAPRCLIWNPLNSARILSREKGGKGYHSIAFGSWDSVNLSHNSCNPWHFWPVRLWTVVYLWRSKLENLSFRAKCKPSIDCIEMRRSWK